MLYNLDITIFHSINYITNFSIFPYFFLYLSKIFNISNFVLYYFILLFICFIYIKKQKYQKEYVVKQFRILFEIGTSYAFIGLSYAFMKFFINEKRPFCSSPNADFISIANLNDERCLSGFPSSHISLAFMIVYYLWPYAKTGLARLGLVLLVFLVGISRITLAMHFPFQLILSIFIAYLVIKFSHISCKLLLSKINVISNRLK
jgi:membrane-associated phospholipid phosphatase